MAFRIPSEGSQLVIGRSATSAPSAEKQYLFLAKYEFSFTVLFELVRHLPRQ